MDGLLYSFLIIVLLYLTPKLVGFIRYRKSSYYKVTKKTFSSLDKGEFGEYLIFKRLKCFEKKDGRFLYNLYLPMTKNNTTEVDVVLIHPKGFFVIESKNFSGWIFGNESNRYWTQTLPRGRGYESHKERFYNPIKQNSLHIKYLKPILGQTVPMWSIIVFSDECTLKDVTVSPDTRYKVIQLHEIKSLVSQIIKATEVEIFSQSDIDRMYNQLYPYSQTKVHS